MGNRITRTVLFAASALLSISAFGAGAARFGTLRNSDWVVTNAWQAVSNKTHDLILEIGHGDSLPPDWQNVSNAAMNAVQSLQPAYDYSDSAIQNFSSTNSVLSGGPYLKTSYEGATVGYSYSPGGEIVFNPSGIYVGGNSYLTQVEIISEEMNGPLSSIQQYGGRFFTARQELENYISTNNPAFVSAVLTAPLVGADTSDLSELSEYGTYGTVGAALLALISGLAALKRGKLDGAAAYPAWNPNIGYEGDGVIVSYAGRLWENYTTSNFGDKPTEHPESFSEKTISELKQDALSPTQLAAVNSGVTAAKVATWDGYAAQIAEKANATDLPYALVTPGKWEFRGVPSGATNITFVWDSSRYAWQLSFTIGGSSYTMEGAGIDEDALNVTCEDENYTVIATRASLPGHLCDRAVNAVSVTDTTTLTLPALANAGKARDFLVRLAISGSTVPTITFAAPTGETITYETDGDEFPVPDAEGTWLYSFTETAAGVFAVALKSVSVVTQGGV